MKYDPRTYHRRAVPFAALLKRMEQLEDTQEKECEASRSKEQEGSRIIRMSARSYIWRK